MRYKYFSKEAIAIAPIRTIFKKSLYMYFDVDFV